MRSLHKKDQDTLLRSPYKKDQNHNMLGSLLRPLFMEAPIWWSLHVLMKLGRFLSGPRASALGLLQPEAYLPGPAAVVPFCCLYWPFGLGYALQSFKRNYIAGRSRVLSPRPVLPVGPYCKSRRQVNTWTPKVCKMIAFLVIYRGFGPLFDILWGSR